MKGKENNPMKESEPKPKDDAKILSLLAKVGGMTGTPTLSEDVEAALAGDGEYTLEWWRGTNTTTKKSDVFVVIPIDDSNGCHIYRWSGKYAKWQHHTTLEFIDDAEAHFDDYKKVKDCARIKANVKRNPNQGWRNAPPSNPPAAKKTARKESGMDIKQIFGKFGQCEKGAFAVAMDGRPAIRTKAGTYAVLSTDGTETLTNIETLAIQADVFWYVPVQVSGLKPNDIIAMPNGAIGFVRGVEGNEVRVYNVNTNGYMVVKPAVHVFLGTAYVTKVTSLLDMGGVFGGLGGGAAGAAFNPMLLMLMDKKDGMGFDIKNLLLLSMLSGGGVAGGGFNPMLLMLMMGGDEIKGGGMESLLLMSALSGAGGLFGGLGGLGKAPAAAAPAPAAAAQ